MNREIRVSGRFRDGSQFKYFNRDVCQWATKDNYTIKEFMAAMPKQPAGLVEAFIGAFVDVKI